ncbi:electron transport complex subunit RsxC [Candidatus Photodesmus anomalopis]|uniref:Ion-translocating oxidoreductase complex subunit C n=1 Tax=Candidatus Photodesmus katoptron Akat1 TaxID=1236703 RepID=S3DGQ8_9GAMM|nr:electron transport complex subunit RsxC [Candidatus Photodesmus katoptron]EPE37652.1 electron transport complex, RnfABCDGE type, C subunit [Candidatus Photodesmus katoptron Akat1]
MSSLIQKIKSGKLWDFPGGISFPKNKAHPRKKTLMYAKIPREIVLPIRSYTSLPNTIIPKIGEHVLKGEPLIKCYNNRASCIPIHSTTSGMIVAIEPRIIAHPSGLTEQCIIIEPDGNDEWYPLQPLEDFSLKSPIKLIERIKQAGIIGMGGAGFPTSTKVYSSLKKINILIINAAECEPYITADDSLIQNHINEIIQGIEVIDYILKPKLIVIAIEDDKPEAINSLIQATKNKEIIIRVIPTKYPSGGEKQLIKILTNMEVPSGKIPIDIGILVQNISSIYAIKRAICDGEPLIARVVTLAGKIFKETLNIWTLIGTPIEALLNEFSSRTNKQFEHLILGGSMMGFSIPNTSIPITKTTNCIFIPKSNEVVSPLHEMPCIRCGYCSNVCPASLLPQQLQWYAKAKQFEKCKEFNLTDCIECGACAYVCPSKIPLVQYYRQAKSEIYTCEIEMKSAQRAKKRFESKNTRMKLEKQEKEKHLKKLREKHKKQLVSNKHAILAAIERVNKKNKLNQIDNIPNKGINTQSKMKI